MSGFYGNVIFFWGSFHTTFQGEHDGMNHWIHWIIFGVPLEGFFHVGGLGLGEQPFQAQGFRQRAAGRAAGTTKKQVLRKLIPPEPPLCLEV